LAHNWLNWFIIDSKLVQPTHFAGTLPKPHNPTPQPKLCQRACKANPIKIRNFKNALSLEIIK